MAKLNQAHTMRKRTNLEVIYSKSSSAIVSERSICVQKIEKYYGDQQVLKGVSFTLNEGEFLTLLGPSGSGKTTTLGVISGFVDADYGDIEINGQSILEVAPRNRNLGIVFQNYALFPHLTVSENIEFGLRMRKVSRKDRQAQSALMLRKVGLDDLGNRKPRQLSGGQQQRVALARALIIDPSALLLDEPLGALDRRLRKQVELEIKGIQKQTGVSVLHVTHDQEEAMVMSDRLAVMNNGEIEQIDTPTNIYKFPRTRFVAEFLGEVNLFDVVVEDVTRNLGSVTYTDGHVGKAHVSMEFEGTISRKSKALVCVRPERIRILLDGENADNEVACEIRESIYLGSTTRILANAMGTDIIITASDKSGYSVPDTGSRVRIGWGQDDGQLLTDHSY